MGTQLVDGRHTAAIRRIAEPGTAWRVMVETWPATGGFAGRIIFQREPHAWTATIESAPLLHARTREDVLRLAHDISDERLLRVLHSLS